MMKKIINFLTYLTLTLFLILFVLLTLINFNFFNLKTNLYSNLPNIELRKEVFNKKSIMEKFRNDYNIKFLPYTQFEELDFKKKKIKFNNEYFTNKLKYENTASYKRYGTFFIDFYADALIVTDYLGNTYSLDKITDIISSDNEFITKNIKNNLKVERVFDSFIYENKIFVSYTLKKNNCNTINISYAEIKLDYLDFKNFFSPNICSKTGSPGRMQFIQIDKTPGLLLSTSEGVLDQPGTNAQNPESIFGKVLFIPFDQSIKFRIFSSGHRVIQGLNVHNGKIIATEHGPRGGDEINKLIQNSNYGWPVVSLGERYDFKYNNKSLNYKKNHKANKFKDPIFSFIPSIGISEVINLPKNFSIFYDNHYIVASLNGRSIFLIRFDDQGTKILSSERIFLNQRIRDLKYHEKTKSILLALEEDGEIGILSNQ